MQATQHFALVALICNLLLGGAVFALNPRRPTSLSFLLLTITMSAWLGSVSLAMVSHTPEEMSRYIRACFFSGAYLPSAFSMLAISIIYHRERWIDHVWRARWWLIPATIVAVFCTTPYFLLSIQFRAHPGTPGASDPVPTFGWNGWAGELFYVFLAGGGLLVAFHLVRAHFNRRIVGVARAEIQFMSLGFLVITLNFFINWFISELTHNDKLSRYAPLRYVAFSVIIAYGISSRGILNVRSAVRRALSYFLLAGYAGLIFTCTWLLLGMAFGYLNVDSVFTQALCSSVAVAILVNSAQTPLKRVAQMLVPSEDLDFEKVVGGISHIVQSVLTFSELLDEFSSVLRAAVGTPRVTVYLISAEAAPMTSEECGRLSREDIVVKYFLDHAPDLATEELHRLARSPERDALLVRMEVMDADLILPIRYHGELSGLLVLASRISGRIYGRDGRSSLRLIAEQLGVAIANSQLYTQARQSQAYNQFLVEHLPCGVIATNPLGMLTVVNPEARLLLHLDESSSPGEIQLPPDIGRLIPPTLVGNTIARDERIVLRPNEPDSAHLQVSCLPFASERDDLLGAVLVINDHTAIERLQNQVRQSDRLASIGTLAAGMAHEIKNPLTALKTFAQLLPKRYNDAEFRDDFSSLVGSEIARIERIVNELLAFARPAPLMIERVKLHDVVDGAMRLVGPQASRLNVSVRKSLAAGDDLIAADKDRLQQVFLNLLLNALQASRAGGTIELSTELLNGALNPDPLIRVDVRDNGSGIAKDTLPHIFDPFFTTKSEGTGLGLSVSYNIIAEHRGRMEVQSEVGQGTCFSIYLPVDRASRPDV